MISPYRNAIINAPRPHKPTQDDPWPVRGGGKGRPHSDATVMRVRRLIETTTLSYKEITQRTGIPHATIATWLKNGKWARPLFAPRTNNSVPRWRAGLLLRRRRLAIRLYEIAERWIAELEAQKGVDFARLREALELLKLTKIAARPLKRRDRPIPPADGLAMRAARARVIADLRAMGVDIARAPSEALADFVESCVPEPDFPELKPRGRYSKRNREHARLLRRV